MTILIQPHIIAPRKVFVDRADREIINWRDIRERLNRLARRGHLTARDEALLEYLREVHVVSLDQARRLLFSAAKLETASRRLRALAHYDLLAAAHAPHDRMQDWGLPPGRVYALGPAGWLWLKEKVNNLPVRHHKRDQVLHDLLVAEIYVRLVEAIRRRGGDWSLTWAGEQAAAFHEQDEGRPPLIAPDGLAVVRQQRGDKTASLPLFIEFDAGREAHGRLSSDWGRKVVGYDRLAESSWKSHPELNNLPLFPPVAVITHGEQRLLNLARGIQEKRTQPVLYYLGWWPDLAGADDILSAPVWLALTPEGQLVGEEKAGRQPLLPAEKPAKK